MSLDIEALKDIISDMKDLGTNETRKSLGQDPKELKSKKKGKKKDEGFALIIEISSPEKKKKGDDKDEDIINKILGD